MFQASAAMTMWAQLETRSYSGTRSALTPFLSCSMTFSWSQRSLASSTTCSALRSVRVVM